MMEEQHQPERWFTNCSPLVNCERYGKDFVCETIPDDIKGGGKAFMPNPRRYSQ